MTCHVLAAPYGRGRKLTPATRRVGTCVFPCTLLLRRGRRAPKPLHRAPQEANPVADRPPDQLGRRTAKVPLFLRRLSPHALLVLGPPRSFQPRSITRVGRGAGGLPQEAFRSPTELDGLSDRVWTTVLELGRTVWLI